MAVKVLYYSWEASWYDTEDMFRNAGIEYKKIMGQVGEGLAYENTVKLIECELSEKRYDFIFSYDYFPIISECAKKFNIKYVSWIFDCPHYTLYAENVSNRCNYFFTFDKSMEEILESRGAKNINKLPLSVNTSRINKLLGEDIVSTEYRYDVSFVGNLYDNNLYDKIAYLPERLRGFLDGAINAQKILYGVDIFDEVLQENIINELEEYVKLGDDNSIAIPHKRIYSDILAKKVTSVERIECLNKLSKIADVHLFTASNKALCPECVFHGYIEYANEMPVIFRHSKINLNVSLRSIKTGIPLRCVDVLGAGGFLLTNYQEDLCKYFESGRDFVIYENQEDMLEKVRYYLEHEEERMEIAQNGWDKIQRFFRSDLRLYEILQCL